VLFFSSLLSPRPFFFFKKKKKNRKKKLFPSLFPAVAPIERVKLLLQTQDSNPRIKSGEIPRYTGIANW